MQSTRYNIFEEFGCLPSTFQFGASILLIEVCPTLLLLISSFIHTRKLKFVCCFDENWCSKAKIIWTLYRHKKEVSRFLDSATDSYESDFTQPLLLSCFLIGPLVIVFPLRITLIVTGSHSLGSLFTFWPGWEYIHSPWKPLLITSSEWKSAGVWTVLSLKCCEWMAPLSAFGLFSIFGLTGEARRRYRSIGRAVAQLLGIRLKPSKSQVVSDIDFQTTPGLTSVV